jgi:hypothetical protein
MNVVTQLQEFRQAIYKNLCSSQDATFELMDAVLLTRTAQSLADLSLSCVFRRQWSSVYEALQDTRPDREQLMRLYITQIPPSEPIVLAGDHTSWSRPDALTLKERTYEQFAFTIRRSSGNSRIWLQQIGMDTRRTRQLDPTFFARENYQLGQSDLDGSPTIIEGKFSLTLKSNIFVG